MSCRPCTKCTDNNLYITSETTDDSLYYLYSKITKAEDYTLSMNVWTIGGLIAVLYENPDFTGYKGWFIARTMNLTLNSTLNTFFTTRRNYYSMTLQGSMRGSFNDLYNYTIKSNRNV